MKDCIKEAIDKFICRLKEISMFVEIIEEGGKKLSLLIEDKSSIQYKIVCIENMFNIDYQKNIPIKQDGIFSKWMPSLLDLMTIISDINNALLKSSANCIEVFEYILSRENKIYFSNLIDGNYLCAN